MSRVLVTGGAGTLGAAVVRQLLADPAYEVRVCDQRPVPQWMREGCEIHSGDLRELDRALKATRGCTHVIHLASIGGGIAQAHRLPHTLLESEAALSSTVIRAALELGVERFTYVSSSMVFERADEFPSTEAYLR
ncbi:MAG: NAD-dependent epimerase/dehydratase family protein, partial [Solirubrobacteraceae bacterium]